MQQHKNGLIPQPIETFVQILECTYLQSSTQILFICIIPNFTLLLSAFCTRCQSITFCAHHRSSHNGITHSNSNTDRETPLATTRTTNTMRMCRTGNHVRRLTSDLDRQAFNATERTSPASLRDEKLLVLIKHQRPPFRFFLPAEGGRPFPRSVCSGISPCSVLRDTIRSYGRR